MAKKKTTKKKAQDPVDQATAPGKKNRWVEVKPGRIEAAKFAIVTLSDGHVLYKDGEVVDVYKGKDSQDKAKAAAMGLHNREG